MPRRRPFRRAGAADASDVAQGTAIANQLIEERAHELPRAHVLGLFLQPDDVAHRRIAPEQFVQRDLRERIQLLDAADRDGVRGRAPQCQ